MKALAAISVAAALFGSAAAHAEGPSRLDKIRDTGVITIGHPETSVPFAYLDGNQKPIGYTVEICQEIAQHIKTALKLPKLDVRYNPTTSATRIPLLANGTIDLECGNTTNNLERHKLVSFAPTTFVAQVVLVARKDGGVDPNNLASFRGKTIAAQAGGQTFKLISRLNAEGNLGISMAPTKDTAETLLMVESGRAAGSANDDGIAYGVVASSKNPDVFVIGDTAASKVEMSSGSAQTTEGGSPLSAWALKTEPSPTAFQSMRRGTGVQGAWLDMSAISAMTFSPAARAGARPRRSKAESVYWSGMVTQLKGLPA